MQSDFEARLRRLEHDLVAAAMDIQQTLPQQLGQAQQAIIGGGLGWGSTYVGGGSSGVDSPCGPLPLTLSGTYAALQVARTGDMPVQFNYDVAHNAYWAILEFTDSDAVPVYNDCPSLARGGTSYAIAIIYPINTGVGGSYPCTVIGSHCDRGGSFLANARPDDPFAAQPFGADTTLWASPANFSSVNCSPFSLGISTWYGGPQFDEVAPPVIYINLTAP